MADLIAPVVFVDLEVAQVQDFDILLLLLEVLLLVAGQVIRDKVYFLVGKVDSQHLVYQFDLDYLVRGQPLDLTKVARLQVIPFIAPGWFSDRVRVILKQLPWNLAEAI